MNTLQLYRGGNNYLLVFLITPDALHTLTTSLEANFDFSHFKGTNEKDDHEVKLLITIWDEEGELLRPKL